MKNSYLKLCQPFSAEQNHLCNFARRYYEEQYCEIILNLDQWFRRRCLIKIFLIWSSGCSFVQRSGPISQFGRGQQEEQFCKIILNLDQLFRRRCHLKIVLI